MKTMLFSSLVAAWLLLIACSPAVAQTVTDDDIKASVDKAVKYLLGRQKANGLFSGDPNHNWSPGGVQVGGEDCWALIGLVYAGADPKDKAITKAIKAVMAVEPDKTYAVGARIIVLSHLYHRLDRELKPRVRATIARDLAWLQKAQGADGQWDYGSLENRSSTHWDLSNTQMAILALSEAINAGFEPPREMMLKSQNLYLQWQNPDGGWAYGSRILGGTRGLRDSYGSMTAAGVASLYITRDYLYRNLGCPCRRGRSTRRPRKVDEAILGGVKWLGMHFSAKQNPYPKSTRGGLVSPYWLYSCERVGLAAGLKFFGAHDWYAEGAAALLKSQGADGSWRIPNGWQIPDTAWAVCFLMKGRAPVLYNKLQFDGQWDNHPRDLAQLVKYVGRLKEQPFQWQVINLAAPVDRWHDAPVLYISAESIIKLSDADMVNLRRFTDTGGTILFEASCGNPAVKAWWEETAKAVWPEWEFKRLEKDHPVYTSDQKIARPLTSMREMNDGLRTIIFYAPADISCAWNTVATGKRRSVFDFGANLYVYATDRRPMRAKLAKRKRVGAKYAEARPTAAGGAVTVARVKHGGDYYVGRNYKPWEILSKDLSERCQLSVTHAGEKAPAELKVADAKLAYLTGRQGLTLDEADLKALGDYVASGGFLLIEAALGDPRFDAAVRPLLTKMGATVKAIAANDGLVTGKLGTATGYEIKSAAYKPSAVARNLGRKGPDLVGLYRDGKLVGLYSPLDMVYSQTGFDAWSNQGYAEDDARALLSNIVVFAATR